MHAPAHPHDDICCLYPNVFMVRGSIRMGPGMRMNRNMLIIRHAGELSLINPVRLSVSGLKQLDALGKVKRVLRLGDFHGLDDGFYLHRYQCEFWAQPGQDTYPRPQPTHLIRETGDSPLPNTEFFIFRTARYPEAALLINEHKLLITTDSVQYHEDWHYFSGFTKWVFKLLGFKTGLNIGPPWRKRVSSKGASLKDDFEQLLLLNFDALVAAHGSHLASGAKALLQKEVERVFA